MVRILDAHQPYQVSKVKKIIHQRIQDNRIIGTDETASEAIISHGNKECKNGLRSKRKHFLLNEEGNLCTVGPNKLKGVAIKQEQVVTMSNFLFTFILEESRWILYMMKWLAYLETAHLLLIT
jgi:hypothetical protein